MCCLPSGKSVVNSLPGCSIACQGGLAYFPECTLHKTNEKKYSKLDFLHLRFHFRAWVRKICLPTKLVCCATPEAFMELYFALPLCAVHRSFRGALQNLLQPCRWGVFCWSGILHFLRWRLWSVRRKVPQSADS